MAGHETSAVDPKRVRAMSPLDPDPGALRAVPSAREVRDEEAQARERDARGRRETTESDRMAAEDETRGGLSQERPKGDRV